MMMTTVTILRVTTSLALACAACGSSTHSIPILCVACPAEAPTCDADAEGCRPCRAHAECLSDACLPDGSCADPASVAFVDSTGQDNLACLSTAPCPRFLEALMTRRPYVRIRGAIDDPIVVDG